MVAINEILTPCCDATKRRGRGGRCVENGNIPNGTTDSLWQGWQTTEERNPFGGSGSTDTPIKQYVWGTYIDECIQLNLLVAAGPQSLPAGAYYLLQDLLYRAVALTNSSGSIVEAYDCDAYGNTLIFNGPGADGVWFTDDDVQSNYGANSIIYCGYRYDAETENYYVRNRYYAPVLGRWITRDLIGYEGGINLYGYVGGNPAGLTDFYGAMGSRPKPITMAFPKPTGNSTSDSQEFLDLLKDKGKEVAEEFLKEAAKRYAQDGDSDSFANALRGLASGAGKLSHALTEAADEALSKGLDALTKDLGAVLQAEIGLLQGLSAAPCVRMLDQIQKALLDAKKGNPYGCLGLDEKNNNFAQCESAIQAANSPASVWMGTFVSRAQTACLRLANKCERKTK